MPRPFDWVARGVFACALVATTIAISIPGEAQRERTPLVSIRAVSVTPAPTLAPMLRAMVEEAVASIEVDRPAGRHARYVLDASVTRLATSPLDVGQRIDCEVSIIVEDASRHAVLSVLTGRSRVVGDEGAQLEIAALRAAARGAVRSLPTALAR